MRQKKAKLLRRRARRLSIDMNKPNDVYQTIARKKKVVIRMPALLANGRFDDREIEVVRNQDILVSGPRFLYQRFKKFNRLGWV